MSDTEGTGGSDAEEVLEFKCRKCPGKTFTAAEKDAHRMWHRDTKEKEKKKKPGPKSKTRASSRREPSPAASAVTLFEPVEQTDDPQPSTSGRRRKASKQAAGPKRKSKKQYDGDRLNGWERGNGA